MMGEKHHSGRLRIAFAFIPSEGWSAGTYYLKNLFFALRSLPVENRPEIFLLVSEKTALKEYDELAPFVKKVLYRPAIRRKTFFSELTYNIGKKIGFVFEKENKISEYLKKYRVDLFFTLGAPPANFHLPFFSWIPDFQHLHYPDFFSEQEIKSRDTSFECSARKATRVILSSNSALKDFREFAPWAKEKARVLSFVAQVPEDILQEDSGFICKKYNIPERFVLLPNQFWKHKNHEIVIKALKIALENEPDLTIVCTGNTNEYRDQLYFSKLLCLISRIGVREKMVILGLVPRQDLFFLMRQSIAVLQPSLFEGWNTTIEEVKSLGKKIIVSDLPVHREQGAPCTVYFNPTDVESLAVHLLDTFSGDHHGPDIELEAIAGKIMMVRTKQYGMRFMEIAQEVVGK